MLDPDFIEEMARVMMFGEKKYTRDNWRLGADYSSILDGMGRHINKRIKGEKLDDESGLSHMAHLACRAMFLYYYEKHGRGRDDLYVLDALDDLILNANTLEDELKDVITCANNKYGVNYE